MYITSTYHQAKDAYEFLQAQYKTIPFVNRPYKRKQIINICYKTLDFIYKVLQISDKALPL